MLLAACTKPSTYTSDIEIQHVQKNAAFVNPSETPLNEEELKTFKGIFFYPIDESYKVKADFTPSADTATIALPHTLDRTYPYRKAGTLSFTLQGKPCTLTAYTNPDLEHEKKVFVPYTDASNGKDTYGGGKYLDVEYDGKSASLWLDFNLAYFPYCAYSHRFSCPLVPKENHIAFEVKAGEKFE